MKVTFPNSFRHPLTGESYGVSDHVVNWLSQLGLKDHEGVPLAQGDFQEKYGLPGVKQNPDQQISLVSDSGDHEYDQAATYLAQQAIQQGKVWYPQAGESLPPQYAMQAAQELKKKLGRTSAWEEEEPSASESFMNSINAIPGVKQIAPMINSEYVYNPGDRVVFEYNSPYNTGTVVKAYPPGSARSKGFNDYIFPEGVDEANSLSEATQDWSYDVWWDYKANPQTYELEQPGEIGPMINGGQLWPEGDVRLDMALRDPHGPKLGHDGQPKYQVGDTVQHNRGGTQSPLVGVVRSVEKNPHTGEYSYIVEGPQNVPYRIYENELVYVDPVWLPQEVNMVDVPDTLPWGEEGNEYYRNAKTGMALRPEQLQQWITDHGPYAYHLTSNPEQILNEGITPAYARGGREHLRRDHAYLYLPNSHSQEGMESYLGPRDIEKSAPLRVDLRKLDPATFDLDEEALSDMLEWDALPGHQEPGDWESVGYGGGYADMNPGVDAPENVWRGMKGYGSLAVRGGVPAHAIESNPAYTPKTAELHDPAVAPAWMAEPSWDEEEPCKYCGKLNCKHKGNDGELIDSPNIIWHGDFESQDPHGVNL